MNQPMYLAMTLETVVQIKYALLCFVTAFVAQTPAYAQSTQSPPSPIVIKFSHVVASNTPKGEAAQRFKELAEKATHGRVKIDIYPNSSLYKDKEEFEAFDVPYIFPSKEVLYKVTQGPIGRDLLSKLEAKGITGLAFWDNGFKDMSANRPIHLPSDMKGLKVRIQSSKVIDTQMRALGATPQVLAFSEVYQALQSGFVNGTENPPSNLYTQKMYEVQKYVTLTGHGYLGYAVIVNKKFWDGLPKDIRDELNQAMAEATTYANAIAQQENDRALEAIKKTGKTKIYELNAQERSAWRKALLPVQKEVESRIGKELVMSINKEAAKFGYQ